MQVIPLGTNGFFPSFGRATMCFAIPLGKILIILDAGTGLFRFAEPEGKRLLAQSDEIHLYLSHYHLDHTFGFYAAWKFFQGKTVKVFGKEGKEVFSEMSNLRYSPGNYHEAFANFSWEILKVGENKLDNYIVSVRKQYHVGEGSLAFRFTFEKDREVAYVTDGEPTRECTQFVKDVSLLLHEHYLSGESLLKKKKVNIEDYFEGKHVTTLGAAIIAKEAKVGRLALIHHYPFYKGTKLLSQLRLARSIFPKTVLAKDLETISF